MSGGRYRNRTRDPTEVSAYRFQGGLCAMHAIFHLAEDEGIEPPLSDLETDMLTTDINPLYNHA